MILGVDHDDAALKTFQENHGSATAMKLDLFNHENLDCIVDFMRDKKIENLDVLVGGPPCQGFSYAGKMDINDKRNFLYLAMVKLTERLKPRAVLLENVLAMVKANPDIQVYGAPYPAVSRFNGGTARELMENPSDLHMPGHHPAVLRERLHGSQHRSDRI